MLITGLLRKINSPGDFGGKREFPSQAMEGKFQAENYFESN
jgi:hypothetical protein